MKKLFLLGAVALTVTAFQSCKPKCGHCHYEVTSGSTTQKSDDDVFCGDVGSNANETGAIYTATKTNCENWAGQQTPVTGVTYSSTWQTE